METILGLLPLGLILIVAVFFIRSGRKVDKTDDNRSSSAEHTGYSD